MALFNEAAEKVFRCPAAQVIGTSIDRFLTDGLRHALEASMASFEGGGERPYVWAPGGLSARRADGGEFPIEATLSHVEVYAAATVTRPPSPSEECHAQPPQEPLRRCGSREHGRDGCKLSHRVPSRGAQRSDAPGPGRFRSLVDTCTKKEHPPAV